ncbi:MAG: LamG domain-containing protein [Nanoarchaeota archaeon]
MRAQSTLEYIILLGVGLLLSGILISLVTSAENDIDTVQRDARYAALAKMPIGVTDYVISPQHTYLELTNNLPRRIIVQSISVNNTELASSELPLVLLPRETEDVTSYSVVLPRDEGYSFPVSIKFLDPELDINTTQSRTDLPLRGISSEIDQRISTSEPLSEGLTSLWHMDEVTWSGSTDDVKDSSNNGFHGTSGGDASISTDGVIDSAGNFSGSGYIDLNEKVQMANYQNFTLSLWFRTAEPEGYLYAEKQYLIDNSCDLDQYTFVLQMVTGYITLYLTDEDAGCAIYLEGGTANTHNDDAWHHLVVTRKNSNETHLYIDNTLVASDTSTSCGPFSTDHTHIGSVHQYDSGIPPDCSYAETNGYDGLLDEFATWNRTLSADEIASLYYRGSRSDSR